MPAGTGGDLEVTGPCMVTGQVPGGKYLYHNVNIYTAAGANSGGNLIFVENPNSNIAFYAESIVIEAGGSLVAGTPANPIGTTGGTIEIHLWGAQSDPGITCKTPPPAGQTQSTCGVPENLWISNPVGGPMYPSSCNSMALGNGVTDCFYQYGIFDTNDRQGAYFGHKVLAVSYGGTLQLYGKKGAVICDPTQPRSAACVADADPSNSGTSWVRLDADVAPGATSLTLDRSVDWQAGDQVVITTTDYVAAHSETVTVASVQGNVVTLSPTTPVRYPHSGTAYSLAAHGIPAGIGPDTSTVETRAAVALLTRSIRIISEGDTPRQCLSTQAGCTAEPSNYYFGGHTVARQGFAVFQVQGVEFRQLGQGGSKGHYPVHFHMVRQAPPNTFAKDDSVNESMTRWFVIHASSHILLARNVGYRSIGNGFYLEDGTETDNQLYTNIGIFARSATTSGQNPRHVPGILAAPIWPAGGGAIDGFPDTVDVDHPTVFWIMNGWNDFEYNAAVGAGSCGACYWFVPAAVSGPSVNESWDGYAAEQGCNGGLTSACAGSPYQRAGLTPMKEFFHNSCTAAMNSFQTVGPTNSCNGIELTRVSNGVEPYVMPLTPPGAPTPASTPNVDPYYPMTSSNRFPTFCGGAACRSVLPCSGNNVAGCAVTVLEHFTSSFNWASENFSAVWLRTNWFLFDDSAITDVQGGGLTFVTGGGYTDSDAPPGYWGLARGSAFVGNTQPCDLAGGQCANPFASNAGPINPMTAAWAPDGVRDPLLCDKQTNGAYSALNCLVAGEDLDLELSNFNVNQRLFNIYDGPSYQDSNAYLDTNPTPLDCSSDGTGAACQSSQYVYPRVAGVPAAQQAPQNPTQPQKGQCYLPNAAIAWKQPNGFFYPPAFHSSNLYFNNVDIRHFVIEPLFDPASPYSFTSDVQEANQQYCTSNNGGLFDGFTDIDRQTVLLDDDGSLTGLTATTSVNNDPFFNGPVQTSECASNTGVLPLAPTSSGATARTSPYQYVTTALYPDCAISNNCPVWSQYCTTNTCYGVPLYRESLIPGESGAVPIRMMGQATYQRSTLSVNNGTYYIDTTVDQQAQTSGTNPQFGGVDLSVFQPNQKFYVFDLFATPDTVQTFQLYVGPGFNPNDLNQLAMVQVDPAGQPYTIGTSSALPGSWSDSYDSTTGILTVTMNMNFAQFRNNYQSALAGACEPASFCALQSDNSCGCALTDNPGDPYQHGLYEQCKPDASGQSPICHWAQKDVKCPAGGCYGFAVTLAPGFSSQTEIPPPQAQCLQANGPFNVNFTAAAQAAAGECYYQSVPQGQFCTK